MWDFVRKPRTTDIAFQGGRTTSNRTGHSPICLLGNWGAIETRPFCEDAVKRPNYGMPREPDLGCFRRAAV
jgi:hypothetical protein